MQRHVRVGRASRRVGHRARRPRRVGRVAEPPALHAGVVDPGDQQPRPVRRPPVAAVPVHRLGRHVLGQPVRHLGRLRLGHRPVPAPVQLHHVQRAARDVRDPPAPRVHPGVDDRARGGHRTGRAAVRVQRPQGAVEREHGRAHGRVGAVGDDPRGAFAGPLAAYPLGLGHLGGRAARRGRIGQRGRVGQEALTVRAEPPQAAGGVLRAAGAQEEHAPTVRREREGAGHTEGEPPGAGELAREVTGRGDLVHGNSLHRIAWGDAERSDGHPLRDAAARRRLGARCGRGRRPRDVRREVHRRRPGPQGAGRRGDRRGTRPAAGAARARTGALRLRPGHRARRARPGDPGPAQGQRRAQPRDGLPARLARLRPAGLPRGTRRGEPGRLVRRADRQRRPLLAQPQHAGLAPRPVAHRPRRLADLAPQLADRGRRLGQAVRRLRPRAVPLLARTGSAAAELAPRVTDGTARRGDRPRSRRVAGGRARLRHARRRARRVPRAAAARAADVHERITMDSTHEKQAPPEWLRPWVEGKNAQ